ncbi:hypothetical protein, partial [uncultured Flavonifractor sp.]
MSPEMTNFDLIPSPAGDGTLRGYLRGRFFDRLTQDIPGMSCVFVVMDSRKKKQHSVWSAVSFFWSR